MLGSKWKYGRPIYVTETTSTGKSITVTPEAFKNENYETYFYNEFFCICKPIYISNIIKSNEWEINCGQGNVSLD